MRFIRNSPYARVLANDTSYITFFKEANKTLDAIQKKLDEFLESKRA